MACLGGTWDEPRDWILFLGGAAVRQHGRICARFIPGVMPRHTKRQYVARDTKPRLCSSCPAYRGLDLDGETRHCGLTAEDNPAALSIAEWQAWQAAEAAAEDDRFGPLADLIDRLRGNGRRRDVPGYLRDGDDAGHNAEQAEYRRELRARDPERYRTYMREYMRRRRGTKRPRSGPELLVPARTHAEL